MFNIIKSTDHASKLAMLAALSLFVAELSHAQTSAPQGSSSAAAPEWTALTSAELEDLLGPIALYPDDLIAIVLPASTFPLQIVQASRYLEQRAGNTALEPDESWDDAVVALLNYPEVLALLNDDLDWTYALGEAVVYQQGDVLNAIQSFRDRAYAAGNLATDERQVIAADDGAITITPADPEVVYVPYYDPARVVVHSRVPAYYYYPYAYPSYYYPYPAGYSFGTGFFWGVTTAFLVSWPDHHLHVRHHRSFGHPYYGYNYYTPWYARTNVYVNVNHYGNYNRWQPSYRHGGRPAHPASYSRLRDSTVVRTPSERRIRSGWVPNRNDDGAFRGQRRSAATGSGGNAGAPRATGSNSVDENRARRVRSGRYDANDIGAGANAARERSGSSAATDRRARTAQGGLADSNRRSRGASATATPSTSAGNRSARVAPSSSDGRSSGSVNRGRARTQDSATSNGVRVAPQRGASPAARGLQTDRRASPALRGGSTPSFGRVAPTQRMPSAGRSGMRREQPMSPPNAQRQVRTPSASIPSATRTQRGSTPTFGRVAPTQPTPSAGRSGMRREQPMSPPNVQRQGRAPTAAPGRSNARQAPAAQQNAQPSRPGGVQQRRRTK